MNNQLQINYISRDYTSIRQDLINYLKSFFPEQWQDFNVASPGMALLELNAYVSNLLFYGVDKKFNELFIDGISERKSAYRMAKTLGYKIPGYRPAISIVDIIIEVPTTADGPDANYLPLYRAGMKVKGASQIFESVFDIDFSSDFSEEGVENRIIEPVLNGNQDLIKYRITKREKVKAGVTKIFKREVTADEAGPFFTLDLPETNVLEILGVVVFPSIGLTRNPTFQEFNDFSLQYWEVDYLPENKIFLEDDTISTVNGVSTGNYVIVEKRFEKEFLADGTCRLTFGAGEENYDAYDAYLGALTSTSACVDSSNLNISNILNNTALGVMIPPNSTIFVKYRAGGGPLSNVGSNTLNQVSDINPVIAGTNAGLNQQVIASTRANNPIPAIGGKGLPSIDELRSLMSANFASQKRCVTLSDYISRSYQIPGKFGSPFRIWGKVDDNKVKLYILSRDSQGKLIAFSNTTVKANLASYLLPYRMINDFIEINDGKIINLQCEVDLLIDKNFNPNEVKAATINEISKFLDVEKWQMNQNIYVSQIVDAIREIPGVINVADIRFFNMEGGGYSLTLSPQAVINRTQSPTTSGFRTQIQYIDNTIFGSPLTMFEFRDKNVDILVRTGSLLFADINDIQT